MVNPTRMQYQPGAHVVASLITPETPLLQTYTAFRQIADELVSNYALTKLGEVYHNFVPGGFTAVLCLSESHISVHTWPEFGRVNLDIYLSNYQRNNDGTVQALYEAFIRFFHATVLDSQTIVR
jgi:S-adenosylmethionine decarboxylase